MQVDANHELWSRIRTAGELRMTPQAVDYHVRRGALVPARILLVDRYRHLLFSPEDVRAFAGRRRRRGAK